MIFIYNKRLGSSSAFYLGTAAGISVTMFRLIGALTYLHTGQGPAAVNKGPYIKRGKRDAKMNFMKYFPFFFDLVVHFATAHWALTQHLDTLLHAVSPIFLIVSTCQA